MDMYDTMMYQMKTKQIWINIAKIKHNKSSHNKIPNYEAFKIDLDHL